MAQQLLPQQPPNPMRDTYIKIAMRFTESAKQFIEIAKHFNELANLCGQPDQRMTDLEAQVNHLVHHLNRM